MRDKINGQGICNFEFTFNLKNNSKKRRRRNKLQSEKQYGIAMNGLVKDCDLKFHYLDDVEIESSVLSIEIFCKATSILRAKILHGNLALVGC